MKKESIVTFINRIIERLNPSKPAGYSYSDDPITDGLKEHRADLAKLGFSDEELNAQMEGMSDALADRYEQEQVDFLEAHPELLSSPQAVYQMDEQGAVNITDSERAQAIVTEIESYADDGLTAEQLHQTIGERFKVQYPDMPDHLASGLAATYATISEAVGGEALTTAFSMEQSRQALAEVDAGLLTTTDDSEFDFTEMLVLTAQMINDPSRDYSAVDQFDAADDFAGMVAELLETPSSITDGEKGNLEALPALIERDYEVIERTFDRSRVGHIEVARRESIGGLIVLDEEHDAIHAWVDERLKALSSNIEQITYAASEAEMQGLSFAQTLESIQLVEQANADLHNGTTFKEAHPDLPYSAQDFGYQPDLNEHYVTEIENATAARATIETALGEDLTDVEDIGAALQGAFPEMPESIHSEMSQHLSGLVEGMDNYNAELGAHHIAWVADEIGQQNRQVSDDLAETIQRMLPAAIHNAVGKEGAEQLQRGEYGALSGILNDPLDQIDVAQHYLRISAQAENKPELDIKAKELLTERAQIIVDRNQSKSFSMGKSLSKNDDMGL